MKTVLQWELVNKADCRPVYDELKSLSILCKTECENLKENVYIWIIIRDKSCEYSAG